MPGRSSSPRSLRYLAAAVALVALVGTTVLGWEFGATDDPIPIAIGVGCAALAVGWTLYQRTRAE
ncbi:multidrug transporter [Halobium salinum]|uniref:Multidrug transporter n=1 Tax=Halobium salinum TaxID=1364940 RepID=A0ABD5P7E1_9EURY|nr:hypothetical protein [Halobium salinum]